MRLLHLALSLTRTEWDGGLALRCGQGHRRCDRGLACPGLGLGFGFRFGFGFGFGLGFGLGFARYG